MSNPLTEHRTYKLDQETTTRLDWSILLFKEMGISSPTQRGILSRALDFYVEFLEELAATYSYNPKAKEIRDELYELTKLNKERPSVWNSLELPKIDLESFGVFPKYTYLAKQYVNYTPKSRLPKIKKPKTKSMSFKEYLQHDLPNSSTGG